MLSEMVAEVRPGCGGGEDVGTRLVAAKDDEGCFHVVQWPRVAAYTLLLRVRAQSEEDRSVGRCDGIDAAVADRGINTRLPLTGQGLGLGFRVGAWIRVRVRYTVRDRVRVRVRVSLQDPSDVENAKV